MLNLYTENIHESYRHFRNSAVALSITIIGVSGAMLLRLESLHVAVKAPFQLLFTSCVLLALLLQYRHFQGYKDFTHSKLIEHLSPLHKDNPKTLAATLESAQDYKTKSDLHFRTLEKLAKWDFNLCAYGVAAFFVFATGLEIGRWVSKLPF